MGATFIGMSHKGNEASLKQAFSDRVEQDGYDYGHSYSGSFSEFTGLRITSKVFNTEQEADDWLCDNTQKWECAKAVKVKEAKLTAAQEARVAKYKANFTAARNVLWAKESGYKDACQGAHRRSKGPAYVAKAEAAINKAKLVVDGIDAKIKAEYAKAGKRSKKTTWLVGGWASC